MRERAGHACKPPALAYPNLVVEPVDLAVARTNATRPQGLYGLAGSLLKNSLVERARKLEQNVYVTLQIDRRRQARPAQRLENGENRSWLGFPCTIRCAHRGKFRLQRATLNPPPLGLRRGRRSTPKGFAGSFDSVCEQASNAQRSNMLPFVITLYRAEIMVVGHWANDAC
jgi:hypothetical protein